MELSKIISAYREENKISQREFARLCGLSNSLISILEAGINKQTGKPAVPDMITYKKLADGMHITMQELFEKIGSSGFVKNSDEFQYAKYFKLSVIEIQILTAFRSADDRARADALVILERHKAAD